MSEEPVLTFGAVGDIVIRGETENRIKKHGALWPFEKMLSHLRRADVLFGNMESVIVPPDYPGEEIDPEGLISRLPGSVVADGLKAANFSFLNLASNHVLDGGCVGMYHTKKCLDEAGLITGGVGSDQADARKLVVLESHGIRLGLLCYCEDSNCTLGTTGPGPAYYSLETILEDVEKYRNSVDALIISIHGDIEFMPTPSLSRLRNSREIARAGATIVLEHHPHVPQGVELIDKSLIVYSLGNFVCNAHTAPYMKRHVPHTSQSFLLLARISRTGVEGFERVPFQIGEPPEQRPCPLVGNARSEMLTYFDQLDRSLTDDAFIRQTWRDIARRELTVYINRAAERIETHGIDSVIEDLVPRLGFTAESRAWIDEILKMAHEAWETNRGDIDPLHGPRWTAMRRLDAARRRTTPDSAKDAD